MRMLTKGKSALRAWLGFDPPITRGTLEIESLPSLLGTEHPIILEVGCNDGTETQRFLETFGSQTRLFAFEPEPRAIKRFKQNVKDPRVQLFEIALSDVNGTADFYSSDGAPQSDEFRNFRPEGWDLSGSIKKPKEHLLQHPWCKFESIFTVRTKTLDSWRAEQSIDTIDFIWVDVQGAEELFIKGATETLKRTRYLYTEYSNRELYEGQLNFQELLARIPAFEVVTRYPGDVLLRNRCL